MPPHALGNEEALPRIHGVTGYTLERGVRTPHRPPFGKASTNETGSPSPQPGKTPEPAAEFRCPADPSGHRHPDQRVLPRAAAARDCRRPPGPRPRLAASTPHKAIRRVVDHLVDHLAELEARLAGRPTEPDRWHASAITTPGDLATFTSDDLDEARSRLRRLALIWDVRLRSLSDQQRSTASMTRSRSGRSFRSACVA
jgi:hypothetical protein